MYDIPPKLDEDQIKNIVLIPKSFAILAGRPLLPEGHQMLERLWNSPLAIVAHDHKLDPIFFYGNAVALKLFEMSFSTFTQLPSRLSTELTMREQRAQFLKRVEISGIVDDYEGIRISATGKKFLIQNATVWNLINDEGVVLGQAAAFASWRHLNN